ncbi:quinone-dependent dihydroorotate dehydrogenase [Campylobacter sp. faydin G-140]|uniref:quinone-dependent dihydroorotate dehydrogenase n=1 Tax=Campylobacter anatolicus TaxID=2829105 RepID=UPI001B9B989D|nr:quinone-dependent dihydroorotate dehydrogenase [Campylobacter anatolicus]MBR8465852.1 quinone-dependent dihydroorotate dehydrogenase [Campylobacter anatolicus]
MFDYETLKKIFFKFDPETAHKIAEIGMAGINKIMPGSLSFVANKCVINDAKLQQNILGGIYNNPVGIGGGFDKNATMIPFMTALGFGHLEFGTFTPKPQNGNEKPRLFRLIDEESIQNAMGFNNEGSVKIKSRVSKIYPYVVPLWANIGKNKLTPNENAIDDYESLVRDFSDICDVFVINLSSPNTPNLRDLQQNEFITELFGRIKPLTKKPILLKIAPDMSHKNAIEICSCAINSGASGVIVNNTSVDYSLSHSSNLQSFGGLSGNVIKQRSRELFKAVADELYGKTVLVTCGGINSGEEAYERIKMGANLVQIFTSFIFKGPGITRDINLKILELMQRDGYTNISEAIGANIKK